MFVERETYFQGRRMFSIDRCAQSFVRGYFLRHGSDPSGLNVIGGHSFKDLSRILSVFSCRIVRVRYVALAVGGEDRHALFAKIRARIRAAA
jgi:hypothetical protein